jgi:hypothetical protein
MTATIVIDGDPSKVNVNGYVKGDILAADATGFLHALPVGPNTDVLTADSVQTEGLKYGPGGGGGIPVPFVLTPQNLVEAPTIATNAALGNTFRVTLTASRILGVPTNPSDGQMVMWEITQDVVGNHTLTLASGAGGFLFGSGLTSITLSTAGGKTDLIGCRYNLAANRWWVIAFLGGF